MRKRFAVLFAVLALLVPLIALSGGTKLHTVDVSWHDSFAGLSYSAGDSADLYRGEGVAAATVQPIDTSGTIDIRQFVMPSAVYSTTVASDTVAWLRIDIFPTATSPTLAADTFHVQVQVSANNSTWINAVFTGPKISPNQTAMKAAAVLEDASSNAGHLIIPQVVGGATQSVFNRLGTGAPTANQLYGWKSMRILVQGDHTGRFDAEVTGFVPDNTK